MRSGCRVPAEGECELDERLAAIVDSSDDAIIGKTLDGVIPSWNEGATRMYGYTADEMVGHSISRLLPENNAGELERILGQLELATRVRELRPAVCVLYMSGYSTVVLGQQRSAGPAPPALLSKPFTAQTLLDAVRTALDGPAARAEPQ